MCVNHAGPWPRVLVWYDGHNPAAIWWVSYFVCVTYRESFQLVQFFVHQLCSHIIITKIPNDGGSIRWVAASCHLVVYLSSIFRNGPLPGKKNWFINAFMIQIRIQRTLVLQDLSLNRIFRMYIVSQKGEENNTFPCRVLFLPTFCIGHCLSSWTIPPNLSKFEVKKTYS